MGQAAAENFSVMIPDGYLPNGRWRCRTSPAFHRYIGIDDSGAETSDSSLKGLRVYEAGSTPDQHDVYVAAAWLRQTDLDGRFGSFLKPSMLRGEYHIARVVGWILGVM